MDSDLFDIKYHKLFAKHYKRLAKFYADLSASDDVYDSDRSYYLAEAKHHKAREDSHNEYVKRIKQRRDKRKGR